MSDDGGFHTGRQPQARADSRAATLDMRQRFGAKATRLAESQDRAAAFQRSIKDAEARARVDDGKTPAPDEARRDVVLAVAQWRGDGMPTPTPQPVAVTAAAGDARPAAALDPAIADLVARIEQAFRADLSAEARLGPASLHIDLGGAVEGLRAVTVTMTETSLDVTLSRGDGQPSEDLIRAAQALADRLQQRFGRRTVRVLDAAGGDSAADAGATDSGGLSGISKLLGHPANRS